MYAVAPSPEGPPAVPGLTGVEKTVTPSEMVDPGLELTLIPTPGSLSFRTHHKIPPAWSEDYIARAEDGAASSPRLHPHPAPCPAPHPTPPAGGRDVELAVGSPGLLSFCETCIFWSRLNSVAVTRRDCTCTAVRRETGARRDLP